MESFTDMADRWIRENLPLVEPVADARKAHYAQEAPNGGLAQHDPTAWDEDFGTWLEAKCTYRDRIFWSVRHLHGLFCTWCISNDRVPCRRDTFEQLLAAYDLVFADSLVYGLMPAAESQSVDETIQQSLARGNAK